MVVDEKFLIDTVPLPAVLKNIELGPPVPGSQSSNL